MKRPIVVFDLDGTLVDTASDLLASLNHCLGIAGLAHAEPAQLRSFVGMGGRVMIERAFAAQQKSLSPTTLDKLQAAFLDHYGGNIPGLSQPYPGAVAAVERFAEAGYAAAVCTNKFEGLSKSLIDALGLSSHFSAICGQDTFAFRKPDPRHLLETIALAGCDPERAIMIGDSRTDIDTAKAAGIPVVAVDFGYTDRHVREFEPSRIISHFDELTVAMTDDLLRAVAN
ncbi:phosphoglycolate phosphatase [Neoaquamicrobium sediminum]|uniref:phosphoglycolate phosphatase n=1 Tax=Neoaquamicrobium sediminum TaxID=1849104 RepID=UPI001563E5D9|nr:phosphoglycolate phosphatase [Mesorhizobium sediminum]NRC55005.1 phosphoglycolate phosphatase [Mesorhizobium sediminum]